MVAKDWDVTLSVYGTEEVPQDVIEDTLKWMFEMNGGIDGVAHIDAQPKNPPRYTCQDCHVNVRESQREIHEEHCSANGTKTDVGGAGVEDND